ncbi:MAG: hypothetical protein NC324_09925, partial [Bacteroides sp.]|nr:hypothetical protein [Bacteroides sp.]
TNTRSAKGLMLSFFAILLRFLFFCFQPAFFRVNRGLPRIRVPGARTLPHSAQSVPKADSVSVTDIFTDLTANFCQKGMADVFFDTIQFRQADTYLDF